jgi:type IV pilus assembly protein PilE
MSQEAMTTFAAWKHARKSAASRCLRLAQMLRADSAGFSLIELMIVVAVIAVLAAIAYPAYQQYTIKTNRKAAEACLSEHANYMERLYTTTLNYGQMPASSSTSGTTVATTFPSLDCAATSQTGNNYSYDFPATPSTTAYTVEAVPKSTLQKKDSCGTLTINQAGTRTPSTTGCW